MVSLLIIFIIAACNNAENTSPPPDSSSTAAPAGLQAAASISGTLDTLFVDSATFVRLPAGKIVFQFYSGAPDTLTLHGWKAKGLSGTDFDQEPVIKLTKGKKSTISFGQATYFGDLVLKNGEINDVTRALRRNNARFVLFVPQMMGKHISYALYVSTDDPSTAEFVRAPVPVEGVIANPSPPKGFN